MPKALNIEKEDLVKPANSKGKVVDEESPEAEKPEPMIAIIAYQSYHFIDDEIITDKATDLKARNIKREFKAVASMQPQAAPAWIKDTNLYELADADGQILEVSAKQLKKSQDTPKTQGTGSGWQGNTPPAGLGGPAKQ